MSRKLPCGAGPVSPQVAARYPLGCDDTGPALEGSSIGREKRPSTRRCPCFPASAEEPRNACRSPCRPSGYRAATRRGDRQAPRAERDRAFPGSGREGRKHPPHIGEEPIKSPANQGEVGGAGNGGLGSSPVPCRSAPGEGRDPRQALHLSRAMTPFRTLTVREESG